MTHIDPSKKSEYNRRYYQKNKKKRERENSKHERKLPFQGRLRESVIGNVQRLAFEGAATGRYPWKSTTEAVEALLIRGLGTLKGDPFIDEMLPHLEMAQHLDRIERLRREAQVILNKARNEIAEMLGIGAKDDAVRYYHVTMEAAHNMPPTLWRDWLILELKKAFPQLAKEKAKGVDLMGAIGRKKK